MVVLFLIFWEISILFFMVAAPTYIPSNSAQGFPFSPQPHQHLISLVVLVIVILIRVRQYLIVVLICISLMTSDLITFSCTVGHLYVFVEKCLFRYCAHFSIGFFFWLSSVWVLYIFWILAHYQLWNCKYFLPFCRLPFHLDDGFLCCAEAF